MGWDELDDAAERDSNAGAKRTAEGIHGECPGKLFGGKDGRDEPVRGGDEGSCSDSRDAAQDEEGDLVRHERDDEVERAEHEKAVTL